MKDIFVSADQPTGDLAGVFEFDGIVGYLYLLDQRAPDGQKIREAVKVFDKEYNLQEEDINLEWSSDSSTLYLKILDKTCLVLNCNTDDSR